MVSWIYSEFDIGTNLTEKTLLFFGGQESLRASHITRGVAWDVSSKYSMLQWSNKVPWWSRATLSSRANNSGAARCHRIRSRGSCK